MVNGFLRQAVPALIDRVAMEASGVRRIVLGVTGVRGVPEVRSRGDLEGAAFVELSIEVDEGLSVQDGHRVADAVERMLVEEVGFFTAVVHVEPWSGDDPGSP